MAQVPNERELLQNVKKYFFFFAEIAMQHYKFQACAAIICDLKCSLHRIDHAHSLIIHRVVRRHSNIPLQLSALPLFDLRDVVSVSGVFSRHR